MMDWEKDKIEIKRISSIIATEQMGNYGIPFQNLSS
jgi:IMP cyclohydrolase